MIKISFRKNMIYLVLLFFSYFLRRVLVIIIDELFQLNTSLIFSFFMCLRQICVGSLIYWYQKKFLNEKKKRSNSGHTTLYALIETEREMTIPDSKRKMILLTFLLLFLI